MSEKEKVLIALGKNTPRTVKQLSIIAELPMDRVRDMLYRIVKDPNHTVVVDGVQAKKTYCYMGRTEMLTHTQQRQNLVDRATHLIQSTDHLKLDLMAQILKVNYADCLELIAYLSRIGAVDLNGELCVTKVSTFINKPYAIGRILL